MSWLALSILSAILLGFYDLFKKLALKDNAVMPVLFGSICAGALVWLPFIVWSAVSPHTLPAELLRVDDLTLREHLLILAKSSLVVLSWICGFHGIKSLPLSIAGPIRASSPVWTILLAVMLFGESPSPMQWLGVAVILISFIAFSTVGRREGIHFHRNPAVFFMIGATLLGSCSALYDKFLLQNAAISPSTLQAWFSTYLVIVLIPTMLLRLRPGKRQPFHWHWAIPVIGLTLLLADILYFTAITRPDALISLISPVRRCAVIVSFLIGVLFFREKQIRAKGACICGIILGVWLLS